MKHWKSLGDNTYILFNSEKESGKFTFFNTLNSKAIAIQNEQEFHFTRTGFWKSKIEISDKLGQKIAEIYAEKWYSNAHILDYKNKSYKLVVRNNPMAEWVLLDNNKEILAYQLSTQNGKATVKITSASEENEVLFDYILWYLFRPIALENTGEDLSFFIPLMVQ
jgi:hypothetical protein